MKNENFEIDRATESEFEADKIENLGVHFTPGQSYNVDGTIGTFICEESVDNRPKFVFDVNGRKRVFDFDFYYLIEIA